MNEIHKKYIRRCIQLAENGLGTTYPNPLVGSVIVLNDKIIGEGWHHSAGGPHAEVVAINSVGNKELLEDATIYVSLEPCSHHGKTPPCADHIIASGIRNIVIGSLDPNPKVAGRGVKRLMEAGCDILTGIMEKECNDLNKRFFTFHRKKRPYIFLKWAETLDGYLAPQAETRKEAKPVWITNRYSRQLAHKMRSHEMAILVGTKTALQDNPSLTTRHWSGSNPIRAAIDKERKLSKDLALFDGAAETLLFTDVGKNSPTTALSAPKTKDSIIYIEIDFSTNAAAQICKAFYKAGIQSLIVEGGAQTLQTFIDENLWDEAYIFSGASTFGDGVEAPDLRGDFIRENRIKKDCLRVFSNPHS